MIDTQAIRSKVLDLAMRGRLIEQVSEDGNAEDLYQLIQAEKQALIKTGQVKKEKPLPEISGDSIPYSIPSSWKWVYLGELFQHNTGKALNANDTQGQMLEYITTSNLYWDRFELDDLKRMPFTDSEIEKCTVRKGDLLVCEGGDIGRSAIWPYEYEMRIQNHIHRLRGYSDLICTKFYYYLLWLYKQTGKINGIGIGLQGFSSKRVHSLVVPLAPYKEAVRIVDRIDRAFSILDTIDRQQAQYANNLTVLKEKLFDAATRGKLTEQYPEDGSAAELYYQIQEQKEVLAKTGELYREKEIKSVSLVDTPYSIPKNWIWVRLGELTKVITKGSSPKWQGVNYTDAENGILFVTSENVGNGKMLFENRKYVQKQFNEIHPASILQKGDILTNIVGASIGRTAIFDEDTNTANTNQAVCIIRLINQDIADYILRYLCSKSAIHLMLGKVVDTARANLSLTSVSNLLVPLPPLAEQNRIVDRLDAVLTMING